MTKEYNHLESYEWIGDFWFEGNEDNKFSGVLRYTPNSSIQLTTLQYTIEPTDSYITIHGYTHETGYLSMIHALSSGKSSMNGYSTQQTYFCYKLIIGGEFSEQDCFSKLSLTFNNLNEFCFPQGFKAEDEYSDAVIFDSKIEHDDSYFDISLYKKATGFFAIPKLSRVFILKNISSDKKEKINSEFDALLTKYNIDNSILRKDLSYVFDVEIDRTSKGGGSLNSYSNIAYSLMSLFSLFMLKEVKPLTVKLFSDKENRAYQVLFPLYLNHEDQNKILKDKNHNLLPFNLDGIKNEFGVLFPLWHQQYTENFNIRATTLLNHILNEVDYVQHFILLLTSLEQVSMDNNSNYQSKTKYSWAIENYSTNSITEKLEKLSPNNLSIDKHISNLRTCIIHPKSLEKPKYHKYKDMISRQDISNISEYLFLILLKSLYVSIELSDETIHKFMEKYKFYVKTYHK